MGCNLLERECLQIGFIGLGDVGMRMVNNILTNTGNEVIACDSSSQALHAAEKLGAETTSSPAALAESEGALLEPTPQSIS